jgi:hypothetical protein
MKNNGSYYLFIFLVFSLVGLTECKSQEGFAFKKTLSKELKEISGIARDGNALWAISDHGNSEIFKLDLKGDIIQRVRVKNFTFQDVEAVTVDKNYVYVGDIGDNDGKRTNRAIIRIPKASLGSKASVEVEGQEIDFVFPDEGEVKKKKNNNYDCEAMLYYNDSLYVFTKRREDLQSGLYAISEQPGNYTAHEIAVFDTRGMVTDAAMNSGQNEVALSGYDAGHKKPFIWVLSGFRGNNFFSGTSARYRMNNEKKLDWQVEGIAYKDANSFFITCEKSKDVDNSLYVIERSKLISKPDHQKE